MTKLPDGSHRRSATRAPVGRPIKLQFDDTMDVIEGVCRNISIGGMFISFEDSRPAGSLVRFELELDDENAIRGLGEVVWMKSKNEFGGPESGFGLKFRFLEQRDRQMIFKLVSQHIKERLSKRDPETEETGAADPSSSQTLSPEALGVAIPPSSQAVAKASEESAPSVLEEPPEIAAPEPTPPPTSRPEPMRRARTESRSPSAVLPDLEELSSTEIDLPDVSSRPSATGSFDAIDLDPSVGQTPMYELGLDSEAERFDPSAEIAAASFTGGEEDTEPAARVGDIDYTEVLRESAVAESESWAKRHASLLLVLAVVVGAFAGAAYLYQDELLGRLGGNPDPVVVQAAAVTGEPEAEGAIAESTAGAGTDSEAPVPTESPPPDEAEAASPAPVAPPPPPVAAPPPPIVTPPPSVAPPPPRPAPSSTTGDFTRLVDITWRKVGGGLKIVLSADGAIPTGRYRYFRLDSGSPRAVVKLTGVAQNFSKSQMTVGGPGVQRIRIGHHKAGGSREIHVVLDLTGPGWSVTEVQGVGSTLELTIAEK